MDVNPSSGSAPAGVVSDPAIGKDEVVHAGADASSVIGAHAAADLPSSMAMMSIAGSDASSTAGAAMNLPHIMPARSLDERFSVLRSIAEECIEEDELLRLLKSSPNPICYDGFEPSGRMHIAQGVVKAININKMVSCGCKVKILVADWFAMLNKKLGGDLDKIRNVGRYMIEVWKALGVNVDAVEFLWSSEEIFKRPNEYWPLVMDIAQKRSLNRIVRCCQIMGRSEKDDLTAAQFLYPLMQCADVFFLKAQVNLKIKKAFCPIKVIEGNPCLEHIILPWFGRFEVARKEDNGGNKIYEGMEELLHDYGEGVLHPADVKPALAKSINKILQPVRNHFKSSTEAKVLLKTVKAVINFLF